MKKLILNRRKLIRIIGLSLLGSVGYGSYHYLNKKLIKTTWNGNVLNSPARVEIHSENKKKNLIIIEEIKKVIFNFDNIFNLQNNSSEIVKLNKYKTLENPSTHLIEAIGNSQIISSQTDGVFDITVQPLWDYYYKHFIINSNLTSPDKNEISRIKRDLVSWKNVILKDNRIILKNNASITLNGIAQGYITDKIVEILKQNSIKNSLVDFGENYALGKYLNQRPWKILLQGPENINKIVNLSNKAVATSSGTGTAFEESLKYHHIFNPKTGFSANNFKAVSIISNKAWLSDALSTSSLIMKKDKIKKICNNLNAQAFVVQNNNFKIVS